MDRSVTSINQSSTSDGVLWISNLPKTTFEVVKFKLPSLSLGSVELENPSSYMNLPGTIMKFGDFSVKIKLSDDWSNYIELYEYMCGLSTTRTESDDEVESRIDERSTINLSLTNSMKYPIKAVHLIGAFPTFISEADFDFSDDPIFIDVNFDYSGLKIIK